MSEIGRAEPSGETEEQTLPLLCRLTAVVPAIPAALVAGTASGLEVRADNPGGRHQRQHLPVRHRVEQVNVGQEKRGFTSTKDTAPSSATKPWRLFLSTNTVRTHTGNLLTKLGAHSTLEAVAIARSAGITDLPATRLPS